MKGIFFQKKFVVEHKQSVSQKYGYLSGTEGIKKVDIKCLLKCCSPRSLQYQLPR